MKQQILNLITRFWEGKLSKNDQHKLLSDLEDSKQLLLEKLRNDFAAVQENEKLATEEEYQEMLLVIHEKMGVIKVLPDRRRLKIGWSIAASILLAMGIFGYHFVQTNLPGPSTTVQIPEPLIHKLANSSTDTLTYKMKDGSRISLSPHSTIYYTKGYGDTDRKLTLIGEARFNVAHDVQRPFIVSANGYTTTALGTEFTVESYTKSKLSVRLLSGKIVVKSTNRSPFEMKDQVLKPGQQLLIDDHLKTALLVDRQEKVDNLKLAGNLKADKHAQESGLQFDQMPLPEVFSKIENLKGVIINLEEASLEGLSFTGKFEEHYPLDVMLSIICQMNELTYTHSNNSIIIKNKNQ
ncbi:FecR family protein [Sphingobacterium faecium]|uniref:FecR family protein n=1 Tax=Sphingobacterium faecium TaxID=34087 RepID=UPI003DA65D69